MAASTPELMIERKKCSASCSSLENTSVKGDIALYTAVVQVSHQLGQVGLGEILAAHACVEAIEAKKDGVGAILHGGACTVPVTCRGEEFGFEGGGV